MDTNLPTPTSWPSRSTNVTTADRRLTTREAARLVDVVQGRADTRTVIAHYLIIERPARFNDGPVGPADVREIEQYRDPERVVAQAADFETGDRGGTWLGAFTAIYVDGKLAGIAMVEDMAAQVAAEIGKRPEDRLGRLVGVRGCMKAVQS